MGARGVAVGVLLVLTGAGAISLLFAPVVGAPVPHSGLNFGAEGVSALTLALYRGDALQTGAGDASGDPRALAASFTIRALDQQASLLIVGPTLPPTDAEREWLRAFLGQGGLLVLAARDDGANAFLEGIAESRFDGMPVRDFAYSRGPQHPSPRVGSDHPLLRDVERVVLSVPTAIRPGAGAQVVATTSPLSFFDADGDGLRSRDEPLAAHPWLVEERVGEGTLLLLADPDLLTNGMRAAPGNARFHENLVDLLVARGDTLVDESHRVADVRLAVFGSAYTEMPVPLRILAGMLVAAVLAAVLLVPMARTRDVSWLARLVRPPPVEDPARDLRAEVLARHPGWDPQRLDEVLRAVEARR